MPEPQPEKPRSSARSKPGAGEEPTEDEIPSPSVGTRQSDVPGTGEPPAAPEGPGADDVDDPRRVAHELLGQAHAVLTIAARDEVLRQWCREELRPSVVDTAAKIAMAVGAAHAEIASGQHDQALIDAGIGGVLARPKRKGLRGALERLVEVLRLQRTDQIRAWLKSGAGWAKLAVTSIAKSVPGVEVVAEALDVILAGIDTSEAMESIAP
jgi:hypothetical protein